MKCVRRFGCRWWGVGGAWCVCWAVGVVVGITPGGYVGVTLGQVAGGGGDRVVASAVGLLRSSVRGEGDVAMLGGLQSLRDPRLRLLFVEAAGSGDLGLRVQGLLGLASCDPQRGLDLAQIAAIQDPAVQAQVVSAAIDQGLFGVEEAEQVVAWEGVDAGVKLVAAMQLIDKGGGIDVGVLREASVSENPARRGMASLLLLQMGQEDALENLYDLDRSGDRRLDQVRRLLLTAVLRHGLDRAAVWADRVSEESGTDEGLRILALRAAMRFGWEGAVDRWRRWYASSGDLSERTRLAVVALGLSPWLEGGVYGLLIGDEDPFIRQVGRAGRAIATGGDIGGQVVRLIESGPAVASRWALTYVRDHASPGDAEMILMGMILAKDPRRGGFRYGVVAEASERLGRLDPARAVGLLGGRLAEAGADPRWVRGVLTGWVRCPGLWPKEAVGALGGFTSPVAEGLAVLLRARGGWVLTRGQLHDLGLLVRGGGGQGDAVRLRAAWAYLEQTGRVEEVMGRLFGE